MTSGQESLVEKHWDATKAEVDSRIHSRFTQVPWSVWQAIVETRGVLGKAGKVIQHRGLGRRRTPETLGGRFSGLEAQFPEPR